MSPVERCLAGLISPQIAVTHMLLDGDDGAAIRAKVRDARPTPASVRWEELNALLAGRDATLDGLAAEIRAMGSDHTALAGEAADPVARVAAFFDRAALHSPEAGVALYSLGDADLLAAATAEIGDWLTAQGLLRDGVDVLDLGCGIGRLAPLLARARSVLGLDVSANMITEARRRVALPNVTFAQASGHDLDALEPDSLDLILAVDSFPYIVAAGPDVLRRHLDGAARALRPGGAMVVLNFSYRSDPAADAADARSARGLVLDIAGETPFRIWDGVAFVWHRPLMDIVHLADRPDLAPLVADWLWTEFSLAFGTREVAEGIVHAAVERSGTPQSFIAIMDGVPVGTAGFSATDLDERPHLTPWLVGVFVLPAHRGRGIASRLVRHVEHVARANGHDTLWLYTVGADGFYRERGWHTVEIVPRETQRPAIVMRRDL